jgi:ABC-2 type transport system ATP-binding protein
VTGRDDLEPAISIDGLTKRYGRRIALDGVTLEVREGEVVALLGPNGAGKTTTVEVIEGYRRGDAGTVRVLGIDPWRAGRSHRARVGLMLQEGGIDQRARPAETLGQYAAFHADPLDADTLLADLGLRPVATTPYRRLSGGERQRLGFALALVGRPDVLLLDEPTAGLDPEARLVVRARIEAERERGVAVLLTTHELADAERLADRIAILAGGRIVAQGTVAQLTTGVADRLRFTLDRPIDAAQTAGLSAALGAVVSVVDSTGTYEVAGLAPSPERVAALAAWCAGEGRLITEWRAGRGTLEELYLDLVAGGRPTGSDPSDRLA